MPPDTVKIGESYFVSWADLTVVLEFRRFTDHRDTLSAELSVSHELHGGLHWSRVNLASAAGRTAVVKALVEARPEVDWRSVLDRSCQAVARTYRSAEPAVSLCLLEPTEQAWLVDGLVPRGDTTVLYGDGGSGKSLLALALAVSGILQHPLGGPWTVRPVESVLYLDWETDAPTHARRLHALERFWERVPPQSIQHRRLFRPLTDDVETIRSDVARYRADVVVCDSLGAASGPEPESGDAAIRTLMALRSLGTTNLVIAHVSKVAADQRRARPFGSVYVQNLARSSIEVRTGDEESPGTMTVSLYHRKVNDGPLARPSALRFVFGDGAIAVQEAKPDAAYMSLWARMQAVMMTGEKTVAAIAEAVGSTEATVRVELHRQENRSNVVQLATVKGGRGNKGQWGLVDRNRSIDP